MVNISTLQVLIDSDAQKKKKKMFKQRIMPDITGTRSVTGTSANIYEVELYCKNLLDIRFLRGLDSPFTFDHHAKLFFLFFELYDSKYRVDFSLEQGVIKKTHLFYCLICWRIQNPVKHL